MRAGHHRGCGGLGLWPGKVVTEVEPVGDFWEAEPEHQDYLQRIPHGYTCHFPRPNWVLPKRAAAEYFSVRTVRPGSESRTAARYAGGPS
jgi:hypothetical protein